MYYKYKYRLTAFYFALRWIMYQLELCANSITPSKSRLNENSGSPSIVSGDDGDNVIAVFAPMVPSDLTRNNRPSLSPALGKLMVAVPLAPDHVLNIMYSVSPTSYLDPAECVMSVISSINVP